MRRARRHLRSSSRRPARGLRSWAPLLVLAALVPLGGCTTPFQRHREHLAALHAAGRYADAEAVLEDPATIRLYGEKDRLLWLLDRGSVALAMHRWDTVIEVLEEAERWMEVSRVGDGGDEVARWLINDTAAPYRGEPYEDIYVNVFKLLAQLERGTLQGGATVEARRLISKTNALRDRYLRYAGAVAARSGESFAGSGLSSGGDFIESPLGTYLTAVTFMETGDPSNQRVAAQRLRSAIEAQGGLIGAVRGSDFEGLGDRSASSANLLVVGLSGRGPGKFAERFGPIPIYDWPVYFEFPVVAGGSQAAWSVRAAAESDGIVRHEPLALVEDLGLVAAENHRRELPFIRQRAILRSTLKAAGSFVATQAVRQNTSRHNDAAVVATVLAGLAFVALTEQADLRCWAFLPGRADVGLLELPPGGHRVRLEFLGRGGEVMYASPWREVEVPASGLATIVEFFWE